MDYDEALRRGRALLHESGEISLDTGNPLFEFAPLLVSLLEPWPEVEIVLTTSWFVPTVSILYEPLVRRPRSVRSDAGWRPVVERNLE